MGVWGKESHLTFGIATISAVCIGLNQLADGEPIRGFIWGDADLFAHEFVLYFIPQERLLKNRFWLKKRLNSVFAIFAADAGVLKSAPGCLGIVRHGIDHDATGSQLRRHAPCAIEVCPQDSRVETIFGVVGDADRFILGVVSNHAEHGAENLLLGTRYVVFHIDT